MRTSQSAGESHLGASAPGRVRAKRWRVEKLRSQSVFAALPGATAKEHRMFLGQGGGSASAVHVAPRPHRPRSTSRIPRREENGIVEDTCELIARWLREKCRDEFVRSDGCRDESDPAVIGDASQTKAAARRRTSECAIKQRSDRKRCRAAVVVVPSVEL
jgi:hypothetical protein